VSTKGASILLTGDVTKAVEGELAARASADLRSTILVAAHHGSDTSTGSVFLEAVAPRFVLYAAGYRNRFGLFELWF
jgi:competence protein ComEC